MKYVGFKKIFFVFCAFLITLMYGCNDTTLQDNKNKLDNLLHQLGSEETGADVVLYTSAVYDYSQCVSRKDTDLVNVSAYITDGYDFVDPSSVLANNSLLDHFDSEDSEGQFIGAVEPFPEGPPYTINWTINGWIGYDYQGAQVISNRLDFTDPHYMDTIKSSNDFTINYTGFENEELISVDIMPAGGENFVFLNMNSSPPNSEYSFEVPDNGTITINSSVWSNLQKNIYYTIALTNFKSSTEEFHSYYIYKYSIFTLATEIFLEE